VTGALISAKCRKGQEVVCQLRGIVPAVPEPPSDLLGGLAEVQPGIGPLIWTVSIPQTGLCRRPRGALGYSTESKAPVIEQLRGPALASGEHAR